MAPVRHARSRALTASLRHPGHTGSSFVPVPGTGTCPKESAPTDLRSEELRVTELFAARLAVDGECRAERSRARRAAAEHLAAALRALVRHLGLELVEPPPRGAATETERNPGAQHLSALLAQPVGGLA